MTLTSEIKKELKINFPDIKFTVRNERSLQTEAYNINYNIENFDLEQYKKICETVKKYRSKASGRYVFVIHDGTIYPTF